jgi:ketosteroid isomerase-like protein
MNAADPALNRTGRHRGSSGRAGTRLRACSRVWQRALAIASILALNACAGLDNPKERTATAQDEAQMRAALQASADAWNRGDLRGHLAIYDPSVIVMTKSGPRPTIEAIEKSFGQAYFVDGKPKQSLRMENVTVRGLSGQSAIMTGKFILSGGAEPEQSGWFTLVWVRTAAGWRAVHDHTS